MDRRASISYALEHSEFSLQFDLLRAYFHEKKITAVLKTGNLTFQTEVATVLVNNARFSQAKGKTRQEAQERAVQKAWEKVLSRAKDSDFMWIQQHLGERSGGKSGPKLRTAPGLSVSVGDSAGRRHEEPLSEPVSPVNTAERQSRSAISSRHLTDQLDTLIFKAAETARASPSPAPRRRLSARSRVLPTHNTDTIPGNTHLSPRSSLVMNRNSELGSLQSVLEEADIMKRIQRLEYKSLKEARYEMKMKRANLSMVGRTEEVGSVNE